MQQNGWTELFGEPAAASDLAIEAAAGLVSFVERYGAGVAQLAEIRASSDAALIVLDVQTGRPQRSAAAINPQETVGVGFFANNVPPTIFMMREDFPDTPHQQLPIENFPRAICIDDRPWAEARLTWTPAELIQRIVFWFERAAYGRLHDARQPLDPNFLVTGLEYIVPRSVIYQNDKFELIGVFDNEAQHILRVRPACSGDVLSQDKQPFCIFAYSIPPEHMRRLSFAPGNMSSLHDMLLERNVDFFEDLRSKFSAWLDQEEGQLWRMKSRFTVIVEMPILGPDGVRQPGTDLRAFVSDHAVGPIAAALGVAIPTSRPSEGSKVGYVRAIPRQPADVEALRKITLQPAAVNFEFDRRLATQLTGRVQEDERHVVMVGAGAIGSHVAECMAREGRFRWAIIDDDNLLPHNLARHTARAEDVPKKKARLIAAAVDKTLVDAQEAPRAIDANVLTDTEKRGDVDAALLAADLVIDASASVLASRYMSDHDTRARRASVFFNPRGDAAVLLAEPCDRALTLRDLEAQYLGLLAREPDLAAHMATGDGDFAYTGACRAITSLIPESRVMALSGLVSAGLTAAVDQDDAVIRIWSVSDKGAVQVRDCAPAGIKASRVHDWAIAVDDGVVDRIMKMRRSELPAETGGVLLGVVDISAKRIHVVDAAPAPPDSSSSAIGFTRGTEGVRAYLDAAFERSGGQLRYVGEWHSHPPRASTRPSAVDLVQLDWLSTLFDIDRLPTLMVIAGDCDVSTIFVDQPAKMLSPSSDWGQTRADGGSSE